ncbi:conserved protein [Tepidicaulis marinus]|uniref:Conserved protein n=2 Tax=Tepidicaulis marinus TaxID=1333998 RepID=A0A081BFG4_9HYPH|nr:conserved protein [Tepidicaulis marinus]
MNSRGLDLQPTDIIKADIIGKIPDEHIRKVYTDKWEGMEVDLTRSGFNELFSYIRMIYAKDKAKRSLLEEFREHVFPQNSDPITFIDEVLEPFSAALSEIRTASYTATTGAESVNSYIRWLNRIDNSDWIPPALLFLKENKHKPARVTRFFKLLERLAAFMHVYRCNVNQRIETYGFLIAEIEDGIDPDDMEELYFDEEWSEEFKAALDGDIYRLTPRRRNYIILRLDSFISDGAATYDPKVLTVEHVLPQTIDEKGEWAKWWPDEEERKAWTHRIANLVPLNKKRNSAAQNYKFLEKCKIYFSGAKSVSSYALTSQVIGQKRWTPEVLKARQEHLIKVFMDGWELH